MKLRAAFHVSSGGGREDSGSDRSPPRLVKVPQRQHTGSNFAWGNEARISSGPEEKASKKRTMQDFFRSKGASLRASGAGFPLRKTPTGRTATNMDCMRQPSSSESSILEPPGFPSAESTSLRAPSIKNELHKTRSDNNIARERIRSNSRAAISGLALSSTALQPTVSIPPPLPSSTPSQAPSQAELDRRQLSEQELRNMFVGAPWFGVEGGKESALEPRVSFRGPGQEVERGYGEDCVEFQHETFALSACQRGVGERSWIRDVVEMPSMLSARGLEPGTVGFEHFLQLFVAEGGLWEPSFARRSLLSTEPEKLGLRELDMETLIDCLTADGELHHAQEQISNSMNNEVEIWTEDDMAQMGEDLFAELLCPEPGSEETDAEAGTYTLKTQILALRESLEEKEVWLDFSQAQARSRVGQLLWALPSLHGDDDDEDVKQPREADVLLLQLTLASELLVRMDAAADLQRLDSPVLCEEDRKAINTKMSTKVQWDLLLAKRFLENVTIAVKPRMGPASGGGLFSFLSSKATKEEGVQALYGVREEETGQIDGLFAFADALQWPDAAELRKRNEEDTETRQSTPTKKPRPVSGFSIYVTPPSSPGLVPDMPPLHKLQLEMMDAAVNKRRAIPQQIQLHPGKLAFDQATGWLTRSWLSGLVLPGDAANQLLLGSLLEVSPDALNALGHTADMSGGFAYHGRQFWSKTSVVGRVLGAARGASESMGWISVPGIMMDEEQTPDGWIDVESGLEPPPVMGGKARIEDGEIVALDSAPWPATASQVQAGEFTTPIDGPLLPNNEVKAHGLAFPTNSKQRKRTPHLVFSSPTNSKLPRLSVPLTYDVQFVTSHPCHPQPMQSRPTTQVFAASPSTPVNARTLSNTSSSSRRGSKPSRADSNSTGPNVSRKKPRSPTQNQSTPPSTSRPFGSKFRRAFTESSVALHTLPDADEEVVDSATAASKALPSPPAHPVHIDVHFDSIAVATLLTTGARPSTHLRSLSKPRPLSPIAPALPPASTLPPPPPPKDAEVEVRSRPGTARPQTPLMPVTPEIPQQEQQEQLSRPKTAADAIHPSKKNPFLSKQTVPAPVLPATPAPESPVSQKAHRTPVKSDDAHVKELTPPRTSSSSSSDAREILVLDCRGTPDLELLARAWCATLGEHALVGKSGRTCVGCCVREARGLGVGVVIRT